MGAYTNLYLLLQSDLGLLCLSRPFWQAASLCLEFYTVIYHKSAQGVFVISS